MNFKKLTEHSLQLIPKKPAKHLIEDGLKTFPMYLGKKHSIKEVVNADGTVNIKNAKKIMEDVASYFGGKKMQNRAENPVWHKTDPNTWLHTKQVAQNAWQIPVPEGYTKQDQMVAALGHDFGKMLSGDGHAEVSYNLIKQIFPDASPQQLEAIRRHMDPMEEISEALQVATKKADIGEFKTGGAIKLIPKHSFGDVIKKLNPLKKGNNFGEIISKSSQEVINPLEVYNKRALAKGATKEELSAIKQFNLNTEKGRKEAAQHLVDKFGLDEGDKIEEVLKIYEQTFYNMANDGEGFGAGMGWNDLGMIHIDPSQLSEKDLLWVIAHETEHAMHIPEQALKKGILDENRLTGPVKEYFIGNNNTEVGARIGQVLNNAGIADARKITGSQLKHWFENYLHSGNVQNEMYSLYKSVKDWDGLAKWANNPKNVYVIPALGVTAAGTLALTSQNSQAQFSKYGGNMKLIPKNVNGNSIYHGGYSILNKVFKNSITKGKALKTWTPQEWDLVYNYLLKRSGRKESNLLQKLRDYHFWANTGGTKITSLPSGQPKVWQHASKSETPFNIFDKKYSGKTDGNWRGDGFYFQGPAYDSIGSGGNHKSTVEAYLNIKNPYYGDDYLAGTMDGPAFLGALGTGSRNEVIAKKFLNETSLLKHYAEQFIKERKQSKTAVMPSALKELGLNKNSSPKQIEAALKANEEKILKEIEARFPEDFDAIDGFIDKYETVIYKASQAKSPKAITYDNSGNMIPLSQRDNFNNPDMRFKKGGKL